MEWRKYLTSMVIQSEGGTCNGTIHNTSTNCSISFEESCLLVQELVQSTQAITHGRNGSNTKLKNGTLDKNNDINGSIAFAMFGFLSLITITFDADALFSPFGMSLHLPHDDTIWSAPTAEKWKSSFPTTQPPLYSTTIQTILSGIPPPECERRYIFGGLALLYGIHTELQGYSRRTQTLSFYHSTLPSLEWSSQLHTALNSCHNFLAHNLPELKQTLSNSERRMLFTSNTLLRLGSFRVLTRLGMPSIRFGPGILSALSTFNETLIDTEIQKFNQYILDRCPERTVAARLAVERLKLPLGLGYAILSRFGELHWSLDHLTCSIEPSILPFNCADDSAVFGQVVGYD
jgi:hypothetical protein